ncbi:glutaminase GtaA [Diaporthe helianthi]|uniref:Glutaminase GtaA n=1 Tax=Diaporthe helianthi TaxID=158607 RepID=A0A2P5I025_DIAHE|nr:glutaminase GtaA [Diaporthe helianthi]
MANGFLPHWIIVVFALAFVDGGLAQQHRGTRQRRQDVDPNNNPLPSYSPARPPAVPLAVRSPYLSAWSRTAGGATLNSADAIFWTGTPIGWEGIVSVDGTSYSYLGTGSECPPTPAKLQAAKPKTVSYDSQYSNFTFLAGPVTIEASFFSPVTPNDICRSSIPLSYLTVSVESDDCEEHSVQFYSDVNGAWITPDSNLPILWDLKANGQDFVPPAPELTTWNASDAPSTTGLFSWVYQLEKPYTFGENEEFPTWGNITYTTSSEGSERFSFQSGFAAEVRAQFVNQHSLNNTIDRGYRGWGPFEPVFAFAHDAGNVTSAQVRYTIGSVQTPVVRYLNPGGSSPLAPWWEKCYGDMYSMINSHWNDFDAVSRVGATFEAQLRADVGAYYNGSDMNTTNSHARVRSNSTPTIVHSTRSDGYSYGVDRHGQEYKFDPSNAYGFLAMDNSSGIAIPDVNEADAYYSIVALSARQVMGAYVYAVPPPGTASDEVPLMFQKEISSDGNINTVDVLYPATPFFLWANPEMLKYTLEPMYQNTESGFYPDSYSMHDLGTHYPNATGHTDGIDEYMPVEESGNMLLMSYAYYKFTGNAGWLSAHYATMKQWAGFLTRSSLIPEFQLSTDDFAGPRENQTNLALKGILGLQAMAEMARVTGHPEDAANLSATVGDYYRTWETLAVDPAARHTLLAYQWRSSWGLLYNTYMDRLLGLGVVSDEVYAMQSDWYASQSQVYGVPLDSRHTYTKSDWELWAAATCTPETRGLIVNAVAYWINRTSTDLPFTDLYDTVGSGGYPSFDLRFRARPVVGGHFSLLALYRAGVLGDS